MGKRELVTLLSVSSWCLMIVLWLFLAVPWVCMRFVIVVFPDILTCYFWFKAQLQQGITEPVFYCDLVYKRIDRNSLMPGFVCNLQLWYFLIILTYYFWSLYENIAGFSFLDTLNYPFTFITVIKMLFTEKQFVQQRSDRPSLYYVEGIQV